MKGTSLISILAAAGLSVLLLAGCGGTQHGGKSSKDYPVWGIDVSKHQVNIEWDRLEGDNRPYFVFLKATEGTLIVDPMYEVRSRELDKRGIPRGAYHFFGHRTPGKEQAKAFIRTAKLGKGNLIPVLDIEKHRFMTDPARMVRQAKAFCREIRREYGVNPIIYCSSLFYEHYLQKDFKPSDYTLWIADYRGNPEHLPWTIWQHTQTHKIRGISGKVDRNVFAGTPEQLRKLILK